MKVFISWSGTRSRTVAEALREWLPNVLDIVEPWVASIDIQRGDPWLSEITAQLKQAGFGIICLTRENVHSPWLHFEAGALLGGAAQCTCLLLIDFQPTELRGPLSQFLAVNATKSGVRKLVNSINAALGPESKSSEELDRAFREWWLELAYHIHELPPPSLSEEGLHAEPLVSEYAPGKFWHDKSRAINEAIREVEQIIGSRIRLCLLEKTLPKTNEYVFQDGSVIPEAVRDLLKRLGQWPPSMPEVLVTNRPLLGNLFFTHLRDMSATICSAYDWEAYEPPSLRAFLLYVAVRSLLVLQYGAVSHYRTRSCILDRCKSKSDIKHFLRPGETHTPFCDTCHFQYEHLFSNISEYWETLREWIDEDFEAYSRKLEALGELERPTDPVAMPGLKQLRRIDLFDEYEIYLSPSPDAYRYLCREGIRDQEEISQRFRGWELLSRLRISKEDIEP